jgi:hypothetical protein
VLALFELGDKLSWGIYGRMDFALDNRLHASNRRHDAGKCCTAYDEQVEVTFVVVLLPNNRPKQKRKRNLIRHGR